MIDVTPDMEAKLKELETEQASDPDLKQLDTTEGQPPKDADRPAPSDKVKSEPVTSKTPEIPSDAEKAEIETATKEAEKTGHELVKDDKGKYVRDDKGQFTKKPKAQVPAVDPAVVGVYEQIKGWKQEQLNALLDKFFPNASKYSKDNARKDTSWKALNEEKAKFEGERKAFEESVKDAKARFQADVDAFKQEQQASTATPEKFEKWAAAESEKAKNFEAAAKQAEDNGEFDKAESLKAKAVEAKGLEQRARQYAEDLKKNPPKTAEQNQAQFKADQKTWIDKASTEFPEFGKKGSEVQNDAIGWFGNITKQVPILSKVPGFIYYAAERAHLVSQVKAGKAASERVSVLEKENGELQAKVKELDALTNPTPQGGVNRVNPKDGPKSDDEEFNELRRMAAERV